MPDNTRLPTHLLSKLCARAASLFTFAFFLFPFCSFLAAQDLHFSQFYHNPLNLNPALTGVFAGDQRFAGAYRSQWASVPIPYLTFSASYDQKFTLPGMRNGRFGGGLLFNYDRAGDAGLNWMQIGLNLSYTQKLSDNLFLTAGAQAQAGQRAFSPQQLYFDEQFNGDIFDPGLPNFESFIQTAASYLDFSAGINGLYQSSESRSAVHVGAAYRHINRPGIHFYSNSSLRLAPLASTYLIAALQVAPAVDWTFASAAQFQGPYREFVSGTGVRYFLAQEPGRSLALGAGAAYRLNDALIAHFELFVQNWRFGLSYDINTSPFRVATVRNGGPEITLQYIIHKVQAPEIFKACPIF